MDPIFSELRDLVLDDERDPSRDSAEAAIALAKDWLETHTEDLLNKKGLGEYNGTMMQWFHWYTPAHGQHWLAETPALAKLGITGLWLPPASKGLAGAKDVGYVTYDLFGLGEFDQKGTVSTKYGTKEEYLVVIKACHGHGIQVYVDAILNHKMAADFEEDFEAFPYPINRYAVFGGSQSRSA